MAPSISRVPSSHSGPALNTSHVLRIPPHLLHSQLNASFSIYPSPRSACVRRLTSRHLNSRLKKKSHGSKMSIPFTPSYLFPSYPLVVGQCPRTAGASHWMGSANPSSVWAFICSIASCLYYMRNRYGLIVTGTDPVKRSS